MRSYMPGAKRKAEELQAVEASLKPMIVLAASADANATADAIGNAAPYMCDGLWTAGEQYTKDMIVEHSGQYWFVRQNVTALEHQPPGSTGMLAIYVPVPQTYRGYIVWQYGILCDRGAIVWNRAKTQLYKALHAGNPSIYAAPYASIM